MNQIPVLVSISHLEKMLEDAGLLLLKVDGIC